MENYDVVKKLIGPIEPTGESETDQQRIDALKQQTDLIFKLTQEIDRITWRMRDDNRSTIKSWVKEADKFLHEIGFVNE